MNTISPVRCPCGKNDVEECKISGIICYYGLCVECYVNKSYKARKTRGPTCRYCNKVLAPDSSLVTLNHELGDLYRSCNNQECVEAHENLSLYYKNKKKNKITVFCACGKLANRITDENSKRLYCACSNCSQKIVMCGKCHTKESTKINNPDKPYYLPTCGDCNKGFSFTFRKKGKFKYMEDSIKSIYDELK